MELEELNQQQTLSLVEFFYFILFFIFLFLFFYIYFIYLFILFLFVFTGAWRNRPKGLHLCRIILMVKFSWINKFPGVDFFPENLVRTDEFNVSSVDQH